MPLSGGARRICIVRQGYYPAEARIRKQVESLTASGYEVDVVCLARDGEAKRERVGRVRVYRLPLPHRRRGAGRYFAEYGAFFLYALCAVSALHLRRRYRAVQVNTVPDFLVFAAAVAKLSGAKVVLDMQELMPELFASKFGSTGRRSLLRALRAAECASTRFADHVIVVSEPQRAVLVARGVPGEKLTIVMNSPDDRLFRAAPRPRSNEPAGDAPLIVSHGSLLEHYGFQTVVEAMPTILARFPRAQLRVIGEGEYEPALRRLAQVHGLDRCVRFLGYRPLDEIPEHLASAHVGVVPNEASYFRDVVLPTKLLELVAMGVPAVVARSRAVDAYFDESTMRFFSPGDAGDLARAVIATLDDPVGAQTMVEGAREAFVSRFGWHRMSSVYVETLDELTGRPPAAEVGFRGG